jgi:nicotinate (nicotinamide) nucleotide adenylyltransferase
MEFLRRAAGHPARLGILAGTFNPPTRAHFGLVRAAAPAIDEILFTLPKVFPHKRYISADMETRLKMLDLAAEAVDLPVPWSIASTERGLFMDIARDCREPYGLQCRFLFLCGRDAADRIVNWDYGQPDAFHEMLQEFELLVFPRQGVYKPPPEIRDRVHSLPLDSGYDAISSTKVRERVAKGGHWEHLVPSSITGLVRATYK